MLIEIVKSVGFILPGHVRADALGGDQREPIAGADRAVRCHAQ
jgi:hypothetical protein